MSRLVLLFVILTGTSSVWAQNNSDSLNLKYPINNSNWNPYAPNRASSNINLKDPDNVTTQVEYDPETNQYYIRRKVGTFEYRVPFSMAFDEYQKYDNQSALKGYWKKRYQSESFEHQSSLIPKINVGGQAFETIFGSSTIDIRPRGSASLKFGIKIAKTENPDIPVQLQRNTTFDFDEQIQMDVTGKIGDNLEMKLSYNTESQFDFDNKMNLRYQGKEDDILQKIEAGNVSMPLSTSLITGSQSLFGIMSEMKFGKLYLTTLFSQQEGESKTINVEGGAQKNDFDIEAVDYDKNRHFLFGHYFRRNYDDNLKNLPIVPSAVNIRKVEVWVTQKQYDTENTRSIIALLDLAEEKDTSNLYGDIENAVLDQNLTFTQSAFPHNGANNVYEDIAGLPGIRNVYSATSSLNGLNYEGGKHYEKLESAVLLKESEYRVNTKLGYISLNSALNADEVLGIAFEYTINGGSDSTIYKVGEFANEVDSSGVVLVKLLKGTNLSPKLPNWNLMMKNIYSMGAYQVNQEDFMMEVEYYHDATGTTVFNFPDNRFGPLKNQKLLNVMELDKMDSQGNSIIGGDGVFDFIENYTINRSNGRIIFPVLEPFGGHLENKIKSVDINKNERNALIKDYTFPELYDSTQYKAEQITAKNKYWLSGSYKSSSGSEIYLNSFNIPQGSVKVTAGGQPLTENQDYTVDYNMGRVKILNEGLLASGTPIQIKLESKSLISAKSKTLVGAHADYRFNDDFNMGATFMNLTERPQTAKVNQGEEPISNSIIGLNGSFRTEAPFLTKAVDFLPFIETKEKSSITLEGEFAQLIPGHNKAIEATNDTESAYIEDFEGSESSILLSTHVGWQLASVPSQFYESSLFDSLAYGYNRAKMSWYQIDDLFYGNRSPVSNEKLSNLKVYRVREQDIYPNKETKGGIPAQILTFDLAYFPQERGPYNYEKFEGSPVSAGLNSDGSLKRPDTRWAGIMKDLNQPDFESQNIEYIEFWLMDPFVEDSEDNAGGELYFNLGNVSEDILKDSRKAYEQGLPVTEADMAFVDQTNWSRVPTRPVLSRGFDPLPENRKYQDIGLDGLGSKNSVAGDGINEEEIVFSSFLANLEQNLEAGAFAKVKKDPSSDDYTHYRGTAFDNVDAGVIERYRNYTNHEGNSPSSAQQTEDYSTVGSSQPDMEDINEDNTLSETEAYYQYKVNLRKEDMQIGMNYITDVQVATASLKDDSEKEVKWYQFRIPITQPEKVVGGIEDFRSIRFIRMFLTGWEEDVVLRFAKLELVRGEWRRYKYALQESDEFLAEGTDLDNTPFSVGSVNIEENKGREPINYILPPDVDRQLDNFSGQAYKQNEQAMSLRVDSLSDGFAKAVYKNLNMDMRDYGKMQMFVHAESLYSSDDLQDDELTCFIRLGSDFTNNYYEYEVPLEVTPWGNYSDGQREIVWPVSNNMEIDFARLVDLKQERNNDPNALSNFQRYSKMDGKNKVTVKGNPSLAMVKTIMIGVRNPNQRYNKFSLQDDGRSKSAILWVNELRLTDFDESGGWAATGRMTARLADFGNVSVSGSTTKPGFGGIEQKGPERSKEETNQVDVTTNFELGKFFPKDAKVRLPMYIGYSRTAINPEYNPLDQDVLLKETMEDESVSEEDKDLLRNKVQDLTERRSINFTNVGVGHTGKGKPKFYSPSNLSATYVYNEIKHHDVGTEYNNTFNQSGSINYVFNNQPKNIKPLSKVKLFRKPAFALIRDINFYYMPSQISYRTGVDTRYNENLLRNLNNPAQKYSPYYNNQFSWNRKFNLKYNLSRGLKLDYSFSNKARNEHKGDSLFITSYDIFKDEVQEAILSGGEVMQFSQQFNANYNIPINKIKLLNWVSSTATYGATYDWQKGPDITNVALDPQNTVRNTQKTSIRAQLNMNRLYTNVKYLKELDRKYKKTAKQRKKPKIVDVEYAKNNVRFKETEAKRISHNLKTEDQIKVEVTTAEGKKIEADFEILDENKINVTLKQATEEKLIVKVTGKREKYDSPLQLAWEYTVLAATGFKQVSGDLSGTRGMAIYGLKNDATGSSHNIFNLYSNVDLLQYSFGSQFGAYDEYGEPLIKKLMQDGYLMTDQTLIQPFATSINKTWNFKATYQPIKDLRVDFSGKYVEAKNYSAFYNKNDITGMLEHQSPEESGSFSMNIWMLSSAFNPIPSAENYKSDFFADYKANYVAVAQRHAARRETAFDNYKAVSGENGLPDGYNYSMAEIAIPAFLATFNDKDGKSIPLNFKSWNNFRPSWRAKYSGLAKTELFKKYFRNVTIQHGYTNMLTVGGFKSNPRFYNSDYTILDDIYYSKAYNELDSAFVSKYEMNNFTVSEQFLPMISIDMTWKKGVISKFEYKRTRAMTMNLTNNQLTEVYTWEFVLGSGYRFDKVPIKFGKRIDAKNDLNLRADLSVRDNVTVSRNFAQEQENITAGQKVFSLKFTADYQLSQKLQAQLYFNNQINTPKMSTSYKTANTEFGFMLRFSLTQ